MSALQFVDFRERSAVVIVIITSICFAVFYTQNDSMGESFMLFMLILGMVSVIVEFSFLFFYLLQKNQLRGWHKINWRDKVPNYDQHELSMELVAEYLRVVYGINSKLVCGLFLYRLYCDVEKNF